MADQKFQVTEEGKALLEEELYNLIHVERDQVIEDLKAARAQGDLSENADYDAARDRQAQVEARIKELEYMLKNVEIISSSKVKDVVKIGSTVTLKFSDTKTTETYTIVGSVEADPLNGKLSNVTPLAEAILDQKAGSKVEVNVDVPYTVEIVSVK